MSLFEKLKASVEGKAEEKKVHYINLPKLDGKVEDTPENRKLIEAVKEAGVGNGAVLSADWFTSGDNFDIYKFQLLASCYDRKQEEEYLLARTYYGISTNEELIPEVKHIIMQHDRAEMFENGHWSDKIYPIHSFQEPIRLYSYEIQPMHFRFDSAIFRAAENGGVVYELASNERIANLGKNAFTIEKTDVTKTDYIVATADNQPFIVSDNFKDFAQNNEKTK